MIKGDQFFKGELGKKCSGKQADDTLPENGNTFANKRLPIHDEINGGFHIGEKEGLFGSDAVWDGDNLVISEIISTGMDRSPTQPGIFQVRSHVPNAYASVWDLYMPDFVGIYEAWPGFENGFHGLPVLSGGRTLWAGVLGQPVSYGCIILNTRAAQNFYTWAEEGVIVEIRE